LEAPNNRVQLGCNLFFPRYRVIDEAHLFQVPTTSPIFTAISNSP
jgi:hypothetical protein